MKKSVNTQKKEKCVMCEKDTIYYQDTHIKLRNYYIEGAGQLCQECYNNLYTENRDPHYSKISYN